jgi:branched-chain amino acid transport system ATP-binding protein
MLEIVDLKAGYGDVVILKGISIRVERGKIVSFIGYNGTGKTTLANVISGIIPKMDGRVAVDGSDLWGLTSQEIVRRGISQIPEGRMLFVSMTVRENLELGAFSKQARERSATTMEEVFTLFPVLRERQKQAAGTLSGGEQQMLAIGRGLMARPEYLILDEPSLGVAPKIVDTLMDVISHIAKEGVGVLLIEQNLLEALSLADYAYILEDGRISKEGEGKDLLNDENTKKAYLGL